MEFLHNKHNTFGMIPAIDGGYSLLDFAFSAARREFYYAIDASACTSRFTAAY